MGQMTEFVHDNIIQNGGRSEHQAPVEGKGSFAAAASPSRFLVADGDAVVDATGHSVIIGDPLRNIGSGGFFIAVFQSSSLYGRQIGNRSAVFLCTNFQIVRNDPAALFFRHPHDFPFACAERHTEKDFPLFVDGDSHRSSFAFYNCKWECIFGSVMGNMEYVLHLESFFHRGYGSVVGCGAYIVPAEALEERRYLVKKTLCGF